MPRSAALLLLPVLALPPLACTSDASGPLPAVRYAAGLEARPPLTWDSRTPQSAMRVAEYRVDGPGGRASLVVFHFEGASGSVEQNFERWVQQFEDGTGAAPEPDLERHASIGGMPLHELQVSGRYVAAVTPGSEERFDEPDWRLHAAIVESPAGPYYLKLVGPEATVRANAPQWRAYLDSLRFRAR